MNLREGIDSMLAHLEGLASPDDDGTPVRWTWRNITYPGVISAERRSQALDLGGNQWDNGLAITVRKSVLPAEVTADLMSITADDITITADDDRPRPSPGHKAWHENRLYRVMNVTEGVAHYVLHMNDGDR